MLALQVYYIQLLKYTVYVIIVQRESPWAEVFTTRSYTGIEHNAR